MKSCGKKSIPALRPSLLVFLVFAFPLFFPAYGENGGFSELAGARTLRAQGRQNDAIVLLKNKQGKLSNKESAYLASLYLDLGKTKEALLYYRSACPSINSAWCFNQWGVAYIEAGAYENGWAAFLKAVEYDPENSTYHSNLGLAFLYRGKKDDAVKEFRKALQYDRDNLSALVNYGVYLLYQGQKDEAIKTLKRAVSLRGGNYAPLMFLGVALFRDRQYQQALDCFQQAIDLAPGVAEIYINRAWLYYETGKLGEAEVDLVKAESLSPGNRKVLILRDRIARKRGF